MAVVENDEYDTILHKISSIFTLNNVTDIWHGLIYKYVHFRGWPYIHTCQSYVWPACWTNRPVHWPRLVRGPAGHCVGWCAWPACWPIYPILCFCGSFWESKVLQNVSFPAQDADEPMCKIAAASFILGGEIHNCTNTQTVNDISTPCLSACADHKFLLKQCIAVNVLCYH